MILNQQTVPYGGVSLGGLMNSPLVPKPQPAKQKMPSQDMPRVMNFYADYSGCGHWRMMWPEAILRERQMLNISGGTVMIGDPGFYQGVKAVRIQRQATEAQKQFMGFIRDVMHKQGSRVLYEIDDIIFIEDIPEYNNFRSAFEDPKIRQTSMEIMRMTDEMTVTNQFMKDYFADKTGHPNITVVPNYVPKFWMDRFYDQSAIAKRYDKNKKKPRILYCGSGAHFDVGSRVKHRDDFFHVNDAIRRTVNDFQWVFLGGYPLPLADLIRSGKIEYHKWSGLHNYPYAIDKLDVNIMYAPLCNNNFNKAKSDLKFIEGCCFGIPTICQDIVTYENAHFKFNTGDELVDQAKRLMKDRQFYMGASKKARKASSGRWLEDNIEIYNELYTLPYGHPDRKLINKINKI